MKSFIENTKSDKYKVIGYITSNKSRNGNKIGGLPVYYIEDKAEEYSRFLESKGNPTLIFPSYQKLQEFSSTFLNYCIENSQKMMISQDLENYNHERDIIPQLRDINIEDLLERESISIDLDKISQELSNKLIMITGAAGSIGSEITRQIAKLKNVRLLLVDNAETPTHNLKLELEANYPDVDVAIELADVRSSSRTRNLIEKYRPQVIYHAAAYKHV